jgi:EAL domain-containing protein (putative c-di-GMP-specific phosphodiesterase class I)
MKRRAAARSNMEQDLRRALGSEQLFVVYQPIVPLSPAGGHSFEALVRWRHPERGIVSPAEFIPLAEEYGLIGVLGRRVLELSCQQLGLWQRRWGVFMPERVSVNLSRAQLDDPSLERQIEMALRDANLSPDRLQLELTESMAGAQSALRQRLPELKALGVRLALDDFGTGYSSLACLHQLPVDVIKIDRSFVTHAPTSEHHRVLIDATLRVARSLSMETVAEGIETEAQARVVRELGCDKVQGYLFGRPMESPAAEAWWENVVLDRRAITA